MALEIILEFKKFIHNIFMILEKVLARRDSSFSKVIFSIDKVKLYVFKKRWIETGIEGPMFVYTRNGFPSRRLIVFNTKKLRDFETDLDKDVQYSIDDQFFMIRREFIYGIWFYSSEELSKMRKTIGEMTLDFIRTNYSFENKK